MNQFGFVQFACCVIHGGGPITRAKFIMILAALGFALFVGVCWQFVDKWAKRLHGRNWPRVSAVIENVSIAFCEDDSVPLKADLSFSYYVATLSYSYYRPEKQVGEYSRRFGDKDKAYAWANSYKGEIVIVNVDPNDSSNSVLREENL